MAYPPSARTIADSAAATPIMRAHPFAHLFTAGSDLNATRLPFVTDTQGDKPVRLRAHINGQNPQAQQLDGAEALVTFSGPATYVSPHWRAEQTRGGTYDYEEVIIRGRVSLIEGIDSFRRLIDDFSSLIEPQYAEVGAYPVWQTSMAVPGYIERLYPAIVAFAIDIESIQIISKLHQNFPEADRISVAAHLERSNRQDAQAIAKRIRQQLAAAAQQD